LVIRSTTRAFSLCERDWVICNLILMMMSAN